MEEASSRLDNVPTGPLSPYLQRYAYELLLRALGRISQAELVQHGTTIYREALDQEVAPLLGVHRIARPWRKPQRGDLRSR